MTTAGPGPKVLAVLDGSGRPQLHPPTTALLRADDLAVLRGEAVFETLRVHAGRPVLLGQHLDRLAAGAPRVGVALPARGTCAALVQQAAAAYGPGEGYLRLVCTKGPEGGVPVTFALVFPLPRAHAHLRAEGARAVTLTLGLAAAVRAPAPWLLAGVKTTSYAGNMAAQRAAQEAGVEEAVYVSTDGEVLEGPTASVAWVTATTLVTPPVEVGILPGTTVDAVLRLAGQLGVATTRRRAPVRELAGADEALLLSSVRGVVPLVALDGAPVGDGRPGPLTVRLQAAFEKALDTL